MANTFLILVTVWFAVNVLFVAWRLWVTRPNSREIGVFPRELSPVTVKWHLRRQL